MSRPVVGVDARYGLTSPRRGVGEYVYRVFQALAEIPRSYDVILYGDASADPGVVSEFRAAYPVRLLSARPFALWEQVAWPRAARADGATVIHGTANIGPLSWPGTLVLTVHDVIEWHRGRDFPSAIALRHHLSRFYRMNALQRLIRTSELVFTVSEHARQDIVETLGVDPYRVRVTSLAAKSQTGSPGYQKAPYFLALGALDPRKNLAGVLAAFARRTVANVELRVVGLEPAAIPRASQMVSALGIEGAVKMSSMISDRDLVGYYQKALGLIYLSQYEGFGLPVLEAMALGCPVIASNRTAIPEVAGDAAILVDPHDDVATALAIDRLASDAEFRIGCIENGWRRARAFSWRRTAEGTHDGYAWVLAQPIRRRARFRA